MLKADRYYIDNLTAIRDGGSIDINPRPKYADGVPAHTKYITQVFEEYNLSKGEFPGCTLRNTAVKTGIKEIFWIYQWQSNSLEDAHTLGINWWDNWDIGDGTIGFRYGHTVKRFDLMNGLLDGLVNNPYGRRHIMNMYQYSEFEGSKGLDPCAYETIWTVRTVGGTDYLDMTLIQRSNDYVIAGFINKIQYTALMMMIASHCGYQVGKFCHYVQNLHYYDRHEDAVNEILNRKPILDINPHFYIKEESIGKNFYEYTLDDFVFVDFDKVPKIKSKLEIAI